MFKEFFEILPYPALHAETLRFTHPTTGETMQFEADPPEAWQEVYDRLCAEGG